jgi:hypothetical protein
MWRKNLLVLATALVGAAVPAAQSAISGRVVVDATGDPLPNARVALRSNALGAPVVLSDAEGRFALTAVDERATLAVSKSGYAPIDVAVTARGPIEIRLGRGAAISGRVVDEFGDPVANTRVTVERPSTTSDNAVVVASTMTDDRGEYRFGSLPAGRFAVALTMMGGMVVERMGPNGFATRPRINRVFYPDATTAKEASLVPLQPGDDQSGFNFIVPAQQPQTSMMIAARRMMDPANTRNEPTGTAVVRGRVVANDGRVVPHADVELRPRGNLMGTKQTRADGDGRFEFAGIAAGVVFAMASKSGYSMLAESEQRIELGDGDVHERVDLKLARWGSLSGRLVDEYGDPLQGVSVSLLQVRYEAGRRRLVAAGTSARTTDDLGRYRLYDIAPGQYVVSASVGSVGSDDLPGYARAYFPGTTSPAQAQFVAVERSQEVGGVDFSLARARTVRIRGTAFNAAGEPTTGGTFSLRSSQRSTSVVSEAMGARIRPDGTFEFPNVSPGQYVIQAYRGRSNGSTEGEFGALPVTVDTTDVTGLVLQMSTGSTITGHFTFDTTDPSKLPPRGGFELSPIPSDPDQSPINNLAIATIHPDWDFEMVGINGPRHLEMIRVPAGWALKAIRLRGSDITDRVLPFGRANQSLSDVEVVVTDRVSEVAGVVKGDRDEPAADAAVVAFAIDREHWYPASRFMRKAVADANGVFSIKGLPSGGYYVAAVGRMPYDDPDAWQDPAFLDALRGAASTVALVEGTAQQLNLKLSSR